MDNPSKSNINSNINMDKSNITMLKKFVDDFSYKFISSECMTEEFSALTCGDAQEVYNHLRNTLTLDLLDFIESNNLLEL